MPGKLLAAGLLLLLLLGRWRLRANSDCLQRLDIHERLHKFRASSWALALALTRCLTTRLRRRLRLRLLPRLRLAR